MGIMLGNLTVEQIEHRLGISFPSEVKLFMSENNQSEAAFIKKGKWHCFDIPFHIVCGDIDTATTIYNSVKERASEVKEPLHFSITKE